MTIADQPNFIVETGPGGYFSPPSPEFLRDDAQDRRYYAHQCHKADKQNKSDRKRNRANRWR